MGERPYYSIRTGSNPHARFDLAMLQRLFYQTFAAFAQRDYFQEAFGYNCVDAGDVSGSIGPDIEAYVFRKLRKVNLWPIQDNYDRYSEDDAFDLVELLYDCISEPIDGRHHAHGNCGWHYGTFDRESGQREYRNEINDILRDYGEGFELSEAGEVCRRIPDSMQPVFEVRLPDYDPPNVTKRVQDAKVKYTRRGVTPEDKRDAIRDLGDILEYLRPQLSRVMTSKDEDDLFSLASNFGIRHHDGRQKGDYDRGIWYDWMFYYYLNTINAVLRVIGVPQKSEPDDAPSEPDDLPF